MGFRAGLLSESCCIGVVWGFKGGEVAAGRFSGVAFSGTGWGWAVW